MLTTKDHVLAALIKSDGFMSGEQISKTLGLSRASVNAAVKLLKSDGYDITSSTRKGYLLNGSQNKLNPGEILAYLDPSRMETIVVEDSIDSTNRELKDLASSGAPEGTIVIANEQVRGRGRLGRTFVSPPDTGIYFSYLVKPSSSPNEVSRITAWTAVAISNAIASVCGVNPGIKWVNDLVIDSHKVCGILTEMSLESESAHVDNIVIGIGINANQESSDFPEEIRDIASSLKLTTGSVVNRARLAAQMVIEMDKLTRCWRSNDGNYIETYRELCLTVGKDVSIVNSHLSSETPRRGKAIAVNDDFSLKVRMEDGREEDLQSGEVSVRGLYGYI